MKVNLRRIALTGTAIFTPARLLVTLKTTIAATGAWLLGTLLPGGLDTYAYYAPFGALIAMTPTIQSSLKSTVNVLVGVLLGLVSAWALILGGIGGLFAVALSVGIVTLLAGIPGLHAGRDYIPLAAVFVFVVGGSDVDGFSFGFVAQLALGSGLGIGVTRIIPPPLQTASAKKSIRQLRDRVAVCVEQFADSLDEVDGAADVTDTAWEDLLADLDLAAETATNDVAYAWQSRRGNARALNSLTRLDGIDSILASIRRILRQLHEFSELFMAAARDELDGTADSAQPHERIPSEIRFGIAKAGCQTANLVRVPREGMARGDTDADAALQTLRSLETQIAGWHTSDVRQQQRVLVATYALERIVSEAQRMST